MRVPKVLLAALVVSAAACGSADGIVWTGSEHAVFRGGPARTGVAFGDIATDPAIRWRVDGDRPVIGSPVPSDDEVFIVDGEGRLLALDGATGDIGWRSGVGDTQASPAVVGSHVVSISDDGTITLLDRDDGTEAFSMPLGGAVRSSPLLVESMVVTVAGEDVVAVDPVGGSEVWRVPLGTRSDSSPATDGEAIVVGDRSNRVSGIAVADGSMLWTVTLAEPSHQFPVYAQGVAGSPAIVDGRAIVGSTAGTLVSIDVKSGRIVASLSLDAPIYGSVAVHDGAVYGVTAAGEAFATDDRLQSFRWRTDIGDAAYASPLLVVGSTTTLVVTEEGGDMLGLDPATGVERWRVTIGEPGNYMASTPVLSGTTLVVGSNEGGVVGVG